MQVCKASQCWGCTYCVSLIFKCKLALIFITAFSSSQPHGTGVKYSSERVPGDTKSLEILHRRTVLSMPTVSAYLGAC